ncbi:MULTISPECIES: helix-turn-helix domain-containing protein [unclassified Rhodococcus (in: high G+C Gram-positive bacteria)]|uniref:helix-turn-helix domain-containing protein n=1 Tax=unclassified Rhodococcus (in: high G+C Gram-positive bacteria) TaxID=192944 RepID=UPI00211ACB61|nr:MULTISPECIES: AraC family transcriptional regulator [unclassified Rhodococcus (in: high G+C Gram-positive bacteria)]
MTAVACETWGLVFWEQDGTRSAAVVGPETRTSTAAVPEGARFTGIQFTVGTSLRMAPTPMLVDSGIELPDTTTARFWLDGTRWQIPGPDDAEAFVARLVRDGVVIADSLVSAYLAGNPTFVASRTLERRFRAATGLTRGGLEQIRRARRAAEMLAGRSDVAGVVAALGYYDEPHLARGLRRFVGRTAGQLRDGIGGPIALEGSANDVVDDLHDPVGVRGGLA